MVIRLRTHDARTLSQQAVFSVVVECECNRACLVGRAIVVGIGLACVSDS